MHCSDADCAVTHASAGGQAQGKKAAKEKPKTREELDAELDAYKMKDSKARGHAACNAPRPKLTRRVPVHTDGGGCAVQRLGRVLQG